MEDSGMFLIRPSGFTVTGTGNQYAQFFSSNNAVVYPVYEQSQGAFEFFAATSITIKNIFSSSFDDYLIIGTFTLQGGTAQWKINFASQDGSLVEQSNNYSNNVITGRSGATSVEAGTATYTYWNAVGATQTIVSRIHNPHNMSATTMKSYVAAGNYQVEYHDAALNTVSSYDSIRFSCDSQLIYGLMTVYGLS